MTLGLFSKVSQTLNFPQEEEQTLRFWKEKQIFAKSLAQTKDGKSFVFFEGPPTANGMPHNGHVLTRVMKDVFPRYKTMRGFQVERKAGWDTHGLPVEVEVEKELRIHGKAAIEAYGIEPFVKKCIDSVFRYQEPWANLTDRIGFWVDLESAYVTYHKSYVESVWWALAELNKKGLLYEGHKVVWWWAQGGTALSSGEVGQGYKTVDDPSAFVLFPLAAGQGDLAGANLLAWTTTPWTLPSNMYAAVNAQFTYALIELKGKKLLVAESLVPALAKKVGAEAVVLRTLKGAELVGLAYVPPFTFFEKQSSPRVYVVVAADFVTADAGSGIVHCAPAFGEDDHTLYRKLLAADRDLPLFCAVQPDGTFLPEFPVYGGRWVKDCDKDILNELKRNDRLFHTEVYRHDYPFCWRSDNDPLIQYARPAWYIRTTERVKEALANNDKVEWFPEHIKEGRFGDFLRNNVDWALSRERYWGTPLNVWRNDETGVIEMPTSVQEILNKNPRAFDHFAEAKKNDPSLSDHLIVHKPWVDAVTWQNPGEAGTYRRVSEVIDCWFDSGCMPFAQWGFPHTGKEQFQRNFPADFISEGIDQTRGWFYSLLMVSTLLFDEQTAKSLGVPSAFPLPYKRCVVLGHITDKDGKKESKSKGNYTPPDVILESVRMDFAVLAEAAGQVPPSGTAWIAREDLEGLDLEEGANIMLRLGEKQCPAVLRSQKKMKRRVIVLAESDRVLLSAVVTHKPDVMPVEVPALPANERVAVCDESQGAPGADAFRWFFLASSPPWNATRHSLSNVRQVQKESLIKLRNVLSFFSIYAEIDGYDPRKHVPVERPELDRWLRGELAGTVAAVTMSLEAFDTYSATVALTAFIESLSNWYVRRSRARFWAPGFGDAMSNDKKAAYETLHDALATLSRLMAPFTPFFAEKIHQTLFAVTSPERLSVHLEKWPEANAIVDDDLLLQAMNLVRQVVSLGLQVRTQSKIRVRQPLGSAVVILSKPETKDALANYEVLIREELNVEKIDWVAIENANAYVDVQLKANFRTLGARGLGKEAQVLKKSFAALSPQDAFAMAVKLLVGEPLTHEAITLTLDDVELVLVAKSGFAAAGGREGVVVLDTRLDERLLALGTVREIISKIQTARKECALGFADRITLRIAGDSELVRIAEAHKDEIARDALASTLNVSAGAFGTAQFEKSFEIDGKNLQLSFSLSGG
jgi:isoleucyl-tRNA synthetase